MWEGPSILIGVVVNKCKHSGNSLTVQWLGLCTSTSGTQVRFLMGGTKIPTSLMMQPKNNKNNKISV